MTSTVGVGQFQHVAAAVLLQAVLGPTGDCLDDFFDAPLASRPHPVRQAVVSQPPPERGA
jgi:hypothetical protein